MKNNFNVGTENPRIWLHRAVWFIIGLGCFRVFYALIVPLDLVHDEAYYWDWSRQIDWGYYSKPPMVAWLIALSTSLGGSSAFMVRLPAIVLGTAGLIWMYLLAAHLYGRRAGFWAVVITAATPGNAALSLLMTIDAPLLFFWGAALYTFWRFLERGPQRTVWLVLAAFSVGLGLLSKQTMFAFPVLGGLFVLTSREDRGELLRPGLWAWGLGALLFLTPVLWWNSQHGWITLQHTSEHFSGESVGLLKRLTRSAEFTGAQFGVLSPVTCFLLVCTFGAAFFALRRLGRKERYLLCFSGVPLVGVCMLSMVQRVEPNWPAAFLPAGVVLLVGWAIGGVGLPVWPRLQEASLYRAAVVGGVTVGITYLVPFGFGLQGSKLDAVVRLRGWCRLGETVAVRHAETLRSERTFVVVAAGRAVASELAFYLPHQPRVYLWTPGSQVLSQYDIWGGPKGKSGWDALIVTHADVEAPSELSLAFQHIEDQGHVNVPIGNGRSHRFRIWRGAGFRQWPANPLHTANVRSPNERR